MGGGERGVGGGDVILISSYFLSFRICNFHSSCPHPSLIHKTVSFCTTGRTKYFWSLLFSDESFTKIIYHIL